MHYNGHTYIEDEWDIAAPHCTNRHCPHFEKYWRQPRTGVCAGCVHDDLSMRLMASQDRVPDCELECADSIRWRALDYVWGALDRLGIDGIDELFARGGKTADRLFMKCWGV